MQDELRCSGRLHAIFVERFIDDKRRMLIEVKCRSISCGAKSGVVVLHYFDTESHDLVDTTILRDPKQEFKECDKK